MRSISLLNRTTFTVLFVALYVATIVLAEEDGGHKAKDVIDMKTIINDLTTSKQTILAITKISNRLIILVSGSWLGDLEGGLLFNEDASSLGDARVELHQPEKLLVKWPALRGHSGAMFFASDTNGQYLVIVKEKETHALNLKTGSLSKVPLNFLAQNIIFDQKNPLSSNEGMAVYNFGYIQDYGYLGKLKFLDASLLQSTSLATNGSVYICTFGDGKILVSKPACPSPVAWKIKTGYIGEDIVLLIDEKNGITLFKKSALTSGNSFTDFTTISAKNFWHRWVPPTSPPSWSSTPSATTTERKANTTLITIIVITVLLLICLPAAYYFCCCNQTKEPSPPPPSSNQFDQKPSGKGKRSPTLKQKQSRGGGGKQSRASSGRSAGVNPKRSPSFPKLQRKSSKKGKGTTA